MSDNPTLTIVMPTVGEPITFETLESIKKYTPQPYTLLIWYDACGRGVDWKFYRKLEKYSDNIILSTQNQGLPNIYSYGFLYTRSDYVLITPSDVIFNKGWLDVMMKPFKTMKKVALVGDAGRILPNEYEVNNPHLTPDLNLLMSREAVNELGSICPSFYIYAQEVQEFMCRVMAKGWKLVACQGTAVQKNDFGHGRELLPDLQQIIDKNCKLFLRMQAQGFTSYDWWRNDL